MLGLTRYQWLVLGAAWLGWGFDVYDSLLFNFVAPNAVPVLLGIPIGTAEAKSATLFWTGVLTSLLLIGWAVGGALFGYVADRIGRVRTMLLTMLLYAGGTAACAFAPNMAALIVFRAVASLGIGGEWAAGASMVAEVMPEKRRVISGAILFTAGPVGLMFATLVNKEVAGAWLLANPEESWRYVMLFGLVPAAFAVLIRLFLKEPELWLRSQRSAPRVRLSELFSPDMRQRTLSGFTLATIALLTWWSCNAFLPVIVAGLAQAEAAVRGLDRIATQGLIEAWKTTAGYAFTLGGVVGALLTIPLAEVLGRRRMFALYFVASAAAIMATHGLHLPPAVRLYMYFGVGAAVFGVFGAFTYYLTELFPTRLRGSGAGFCYNMGRIVAAIGPLILGVIAARGTGASDAAENFLFWVGVVPVAGLLIMPWVTETRGRPLPA